MPRPFSICVAGGGSWGTALAHHLAGRGHDVILWLRDSRISQAINAGHENPRYLAGYPLHKNLAATTDPAALAREIIVSAIPCQQLRAWLNAYKDRLSGGSVLVNAAKGLETGNLALGHAVADDVLGGAGSRGSAPKDGAPFRYAALSGPSFAAEVMKGLPTAVVLASRDALLARHLQVIFSGPAFRCYASTDIIGVEMGGALKNVMAIATGLCDGLELGLNSRAALITRGLAEMCRLGLARGARERTFMGLSGLGDLILTCTGRLSRNRQVGLRLGRGESIDAILHSLGMVAEGVKTTAAAYDLARRLHAEAPVISTVYSVVQMGHSPAKAVKTLMARALREE
ncbi:MAG: NAD(P)-dependent glycerol-3-phosphate dehydrogenase [Desulfovibrio sp.]|jgi:glycerol-3-phosphate dehydrogenase (NAD(P)+)|nr:NAD(P)-dependent glycerol-3-phosphate dehydrogenase [Desulfovibrio sp.]